MKSPKIIAVIPARLASTRFPGKLLVKVLGKTILQRTFEQVAKCSFFQDIFIVTDDESIYSHVKEFKANAVFAKPVMTSKNCLNGTERIIEALRKNKEIENADIIINVQGDHPLIDPKTIKAVSDILINDSRAVMSTGATLFTDPHDALSPNAVKVVFDKNQNALYFSRSLIPFSKNLDKTKLYYHIGIYGYRVSFLKELSNLEATNCQMAEDLEQLKVLEHGFKIKVALVDKNPIGVDVFEDVNKVERHLCQ
jgi:3-deoxy-manno-octulosonate cytidylyltransferase (CMP-KDO synthetase)